jgi:hypothetical protein
MGENKMSASFMAACTACIPILLLTTGCASVTGGPSQSVAVHTRDQAGQEVLGASCELSNSKGRWTVTTPASATINRSNDDMHVICSKAGLQPARAEVVSVTKDAMFGNILIGGGVGAFIDHSSGAAYEYPSYIPLVMGRFIRIEGPEDPVAQPPMVPMTNALQPASAPRPAEPPSTPKAVLPAAEIEARLKELRRLRDAGLVTEEVYQDQQRRVLGLR